VTHAIRLVSSTLFAAIILAAPAFAQAPTPSKAKALAADATKPVAPPVAAKPAPTAVAAKPAPIHRALVSTSPNPTVDEGTVQRISAAMLSYSVLEVQGGWPTLPASVAKLAPGAKGPEVALLRQRLAITEDLPSDRIEGDVYDETVVAAVKFFQGRHGLEETGAIGPKTLAALNVPVTKRLRQLGASLDRLAAMDIAFGQRYVIVNLPAAFAEAIEGDKVVRRYVVQVGRPERPSPTLTTNITTVNLNPTWTVPLGILKKDVIPRMRKDPSYAARMHMKVLDGAGREVDAASVDWNSDHAPNFTIRQDSGNWNALGSVRIDMPNPHSVYMHDTNHKEFFSADYRFQSSGCTRVEDPRALATWLLADNPGWGRKEIDAAIAKGERMDVRLGHKVPVAWVYLTGWATRDNVIHFRDDIYGHDEKPTLVADARPQVASAARANGFVLQSADVRPAEVKSVSFLDSQ
jgi:murein L,D-transpeptidase YcbB/YkuD